MKYKKLLLWMLLIDFTAFSIWVISQVGYFGVFAAGMSNVGSLQITLDLVLCALCICFWLKGDAESKQINPYPWIAAILATGAVGVLSYLLYREYRIERKQALDLSAYHSA